MTIAIALIVLVLATVLFHFLSPWWFTPIASNWNAVDSTVDVTFWVTGIVFVAVNLFLAYAIIRYRHRKGRTEGVHYEPENKKLEWWLTGITSVGIAAMLAPGLSVWAQFVTVPEDAQVVEVLGQQWSWAYRFPGSDGQLGRSDNHLISVDNPLGIDPTDPVGQDDRVVVTPQLHLPNQTSVQFKLRARDVNHQFAVPQFRMKMDMVPGMVTSFWVDLERPGEYDVLCEQLCGMAHFAMRGRIVVEEEGKFKTWLAAQPTFASTLSVKGDAAAGQALFAPCTTCHGAKAEGNRDLNAPKLSGQDDWYLVRQLQNFKGGVRGAHEKDIYAKQMIPFASMLADDQAVRNVVAYIKTLPEVRPNATAMGNPDHGRKLYETCSSCHGDKAKGNWATNAPRLANMSDWYLARQLQNFRGGIRGSHPQDFHGAQMVSMAKTIKDDEAIADLLDYMRTL